MGCALGIFRLYCNFRHPNARWSESKTTRDRHTAQRGELLLRERNRVRCGRIVLVALQIPSSKFAAQVRK